MALNTPTLTLEQRGLLKTSLTGMKKALKHVCLVVPVSWQNRGQLETFTRGSGGSAGADLYDAFVERFKPQLVEQRLECDNPFGLRYLRVPDSRPAEGEGLNEKPFVIDANNYFFQRGRMNARHEAWINMGNNDAQAGNWLEAHRGKNFILQLRRNLRAFCSFQHKNHMLVNGFVRFCRGVTMNYAQQTGFGLRADTAALPAGLAERLVDFFYLGKDEAALLTGLNLTDFPVPDWQWAQNEGKFREWLPKMASAYRRALLSGPGSMGENDLTDIPKLFQKANGLQDDDLQGFRDAQAALRIILEMLPSRVLPQETLAWLLQELFEEACGEANTSNPEKLIEVARCIDSGKEGTIKPPENTALAKSDREAWKTRLLSKLGEMVDVLADGAQSTAQCLKSIRSLFQGYPAAVLKKIGADRIPSIQGLIRVLVPAQLQNDERTAAIRGAKAFLEIILQSEIFPQLFDSPVMSLKQLLERVMGDNLGLALVAFSSLKPGGLGALATLAEPKKAISDLAKRATETLGRDLDQEVGLPLLLDFLEKMASGAGELEKTVQLFIKAQELIRLSPPAEPGQIVSSLQALRPRQQRGEELTSVQRSQYAVGKAFLMQRYHTKREEYEKLRPIAQELEPLVQAAEARLREAAADLARVKVVEIESADGGVEAHKAAVAWAEKRCREAAAAVQTLQKKRDEIRTVAQDQGVPAPRPAEGAPSSPVSEENADAIIDDIFLKVGMDTRAQAAPPSDLEQQVSQALDEFLAEPSNKAAIAALLTANESLNHLVYEKYVEALKDAGQISYCRRLEAMTLGRMMVANRDRCGLGSDSSGFLRLLTDLIQETGEDQKGLVVTGIQLLKSHSLHEYLDGGLLKTGANVSKLRDDLATAARQSFENITDFVSELQAIRYLFELAPADSQISIFNGTSTEFGVWLEKHHLAGNGDGPFAVGSGDNLPGLVYLSEAAGSDLSLPALRSGGLAFLMPPVVKGTSGHGSAAVSGYPCLTLGPAFPLNEDDQEMPTKLPAPYPFMVKFLNRAQQPGLNKNPRGNNAGGFDYNVSGVGAGVDFAVNLVLNDTFPSHYHLYVFLRLYAQMFLLHGQSRDKWLPSFANHWYSAAPPELWTALDASSAAPDALSVREAFPSGSAKTYRFAGSIAGTPWPGMTMQKIDGAEATLMIRLPPWFLSAVQKF